MNKIYLIRHAESVANTIGTYQGQTYDTGLSPLGERQAKALAMRLKREEFDEVYCSPLKRTLLTAQTIAGFHERHVEVITDTDIVETDHGRWEGLKKEEVELRWPRLYRKWQIDPGNVKFPGGERFAGTSQRAVSWFTKISARKGKFAVVTHANIIQAILVHVRGYELNSMWEISIDPAAVNIVETHSPPQITVLNETGHLVGIRADLSIHAI